MTAVAFVVALIVGVVVHKCMDCFFNRKHVGILGLKFEKDPLRSCEEICISLVMHVYLRFIFVFSTFQIQAFKAMKK